MSLIKSGIIVGLFTLLSRIFGYIRDIFIASYLGTSSTADAFTVAFKLPNFFRTIFAEGAFSAAFIPIFTKKYSKSDPQSSINLASNVLAFMIATLLILIILFEIFMPYVMYLLAPGFTTDQEKFNLVVTLARITFPYLLFISVSTLFSGILNSINKFAIAAALPVILNITMILLIFFGSEKFQTPAHALAYGALISGIIQTAVVIFAAFKVSILLKIKLPNIDNDLKLMFKNMIPAIISSGIVQINLWVGTIIATKIQGAVSTLYYIERLNQFPLAIIGTAISTVLLPTISKQLRQNMKEQAVITQNKALEISLFLALPAALALILIGDIIVEVLFQRHAFTLDDTKVVAGGLAIVAIGLPAYVMNKIFIPRFFADFDTKTPVKISLISMVCNVILSLVLVKFLGFIGIVLASSFSGWLNVILLVYFLYTKNAFRFEKSTLRTIGKIILACVIMGITLYCARSIMPNFSDHIIYHLLMLIFCGLTSYLLAGYGLRIFSYQLIKKDILGT